MHWRSACKDGFVKIDSLQQIVNANCLHKLTNTFSFQITITQLLHSNNEKHVKLFYIDFISTWGQLLYSKISFILQIHCVFSWKLISKQKVCFVFYKKGYSQDYLFPIAAPPLHKDLHKSEIEQFLPSILYLGKGWLPCGSDCRAAFGVLVGSRGTGSPLICVAQRCEVTTVLHTWSPLKFFTHAVAVKDITLTRFTLGNTEKKAKTIYGRIHSLFFSSGKVYASLPLSDYHPNLFVSEPNLSKSIWYFLWQLHMIATPTKLCLWYQQTANYGKTWILTSVLYQRLQ